MQAILLSSLVENFQTPSQNHLRASAGGFEYSNTVV
jgi:hypothetical protein